MYITLLDSGPAYSLYALVIKGKCQIKEFLNSLSGKDLTQIFALLNRILEHGPPNNKRKFRIVNKNIFELKTQGGIRILCFMGGQKLDKSLILTHGIRKTAKGKFQREIAKAIGWQIEFFKSADLKIDEGG
jgi:hypothetical protein